MKTILSAAIGALLALSAVQAGAQAKAAERKMELAIEEQSLADALNEWAKQTGLQLVSPSSEMMNTKVARSIKGTYSPQAALNELLKGTTLTYEWVSERAVAIREKSQIMPAALETTGAREHVEVPRLQLAAAQDLRIEGAGEVRAQDGQPGGPEREQEVEELGEIIVTGTRIRAASSIAAPSLAISRSDIEQGGYATVESVLESLPQHFDGVTPEGRLASEGGSRLSQINNNRVSAVDLRGLGPESTLTLLNGTRRAGSIGGRVVDVSAIPLSVIDRVEIVTGGRSAIYGSDAVAGVVNFVTRRDFDGAETSMDYGFADSGGEQLQLSQIVGWSGEKGGMVAAYDYLKAWPLDLAEVGLLANEDLGSGQPLSMNVLAASRRHSGFVSGRYSPTVGIELYGDALYTDQKSDDTSRRLFSGATSESFETNINPSEQYSSTAGVRADFGAGWNVNVSATHARADMRWDSSGFIDLGFFSTPFVGLIAEKSEISSFATVFEGPVPIKVLDGTRAALGVEIRREDYSERLVFDEVPFSDRTSDRTIRSAFAEVSLPFFQLNQGGSRLEMSLAGRYDEYDDFGHTFNPQAGITWNVTNSLAIRAAYSSAFRAPALAELGAETSLFIESIQDPTEGGSAVPVLFAQGDNENLDPEEADTWSIGLELHPFAIPELRLAVSYFNIRYDGRLEQPTVNADRPFVLEREAQFPGFLNRGPSASEIAEFVGAVPPEMISNQTGQPWDQTSEPISAAFPNLILFDNRVSNIATEELDGIDLLLKSATESRLGQMSVALNAAYTLNHDRKVTRTSPEFTLLNEVGKAADLKARATFGLERGPYAGHLHINYTDSYSNPFTTPSSTIDSWTTADVTLQYRGATFFGSGSRQINTALSVRNIFNEKPPEFLGGFTGIRYDTANASPIGRFVSLRVSVDW